MRSNVIQEILATEKKYIISLEDILEVSTENIKLGLYQNPQPLPINKIERRMTSERYSVFNSVIYIRSIYTIYLTSIQCRLNVTINALQHMFFSHDEL